MCRAVEPTCPARLSWLSPRRWRHCRSRAPNGLAWRVTGASMAAAPPYHDSLPGNRLAGGWPPTLVGMAELSTDLVVAAPADRVWEVIGRRFDRIGDWATAVPHSTALPDAAAGIAGSTLPIVAAALDAPVPGRVCQTSIRLVPQVTETLIAYDDANRTLTYQASGMPAFVTLARNTWTVTAIDADHSRVNLHARFDTRGLLGLFGRWAILVRTRRTSRHLTEDLRHYVLTGQPSPRKQRQQRRGAARITTR